MNANERWIPENEDGSGWADVDWGSVVRGSRYHYRHGEPADAARALLPTSFRVVTRMESADLEPHENSYYVPSRLLADFLAELLMVGGNEVIWKIEPCADPPAESRIGLIQESGR